jgi:hypothetical protein
LVPQPSRRRVWRTLKPLPLLNAGLRRILVESRAVAHSLTGQPLRDKLREGLASVFTSLLGETAGKILPQSRNRPLVSASELLPRPLPHRRHDRHLLDACPLELRAKSRATCGADASNRRRARGEVRLHTRGSGHLPVWRVHRSSRTLTAPTCGYRRSHPKSLAPSTVRPTPA